MLKFQAFYKQFTIPEFKALIGKYSRNIVLIMIIFLLTLLAMGFANGINGYLEKKMNDPFIKFVKILIPSGNENFNWQTLNTDTLQKRFGYNTIEPVYFEYTNVLAKSGEPEGVKARKINTESEFYKFIVQNQEILKSDPLALENSFNNNVYSVIITRSLLKKLGYKKEKVPFINLVHYINQKEYYIPIPVAGIVSQLPEYADILITEKLYSALQNKYYKLNITSSYHKNYFRFYIDDINRNIEEKLKTEENYKKKPVKGSAFAEGEMFEKLGVQDLQAEKDKIKRMLNDSLIRLYNLDRGRSPEDRYESQVDYISIPFNNMDSISVFNNYIKENYGLNIDMSTIKAKKNFASFNNLSFFLSVVLNIFSILIITLFVSKIVLAHIEKNKKNLGTLKAFGLSNISIVLMYSILSLIMIIIAFVISVMITHFFGDIFINLILNMMDFNIPADSVSFDYSYLSLPTLIFMAAIVFIIILFIYLVLKKQTPGNLIYERI